MRRLDMMAKYSVFVLLLFALSTTLQAQLSEGNIAGALSDASGAAVAGASVKITNLQTGSVAETKTDNIGYYRFPHLQPGAYQIRIEAQGFKATVLESIPVNVDATTRADARLQVGTARETVEVAEGAALVQTEEARLTNTITREEIENLPLNGRQVYQLVSLEPGVTQTNAPVVSNVPSPTSSVTFDFGYIANGSTPRGNNFVLDGNSNNNEWLGGTPLIYPSLDAIQELQVQTLNFSAEYGRNNGTVVNVVTKSGGNHLHGSLFYTGRNTALNARNFFDQVQKTPLQQNQFGFSLGGPIVRDKTFFFIDYEGSRLKDGAPAIFTSETPAFRQSVITGSPSSLAAIFYHDFPGPGCVGAPFGFENQYCSAASSQIERNQADQYLVRVDQHLGMHDQLYGRWVNTLASGDVARQELQGAAARGFKAPFDGFFADLGLGETHEFSSQTLNDLRVAYSRNNSRIGFGLPPNATSGAILKGAGLPLDSFGDLVFDDGVLPMGGEVFVPRKFIFNTYALSDTLTHIVGRHALRFGFQVRHIQENSNYQLTSKPFFEFASVLSFAIDQPYLQAALVNRNNCTGSPSPTCGQFTDTPRHFRWNQFAGFAQDDWKVGQRLTLNLGLRYEVFESPTEAKGILSNIVLGSGKNLFQQIGNATVGRVGELWNTDKKNFAPRIGLSWDPRGKGDMVVRSGFSVAYNEPYSNLYTNASRLDPPDAITTFVEPSLGIGISPIPYGPSQFPFQPSPDFSGPTLPNGGIGPASSNVAITPSGVAHNLRTAYSLQWFFGIQRQFLHDYALSINYVGTRGVGGYTREDVNRFDGDVCQNLATNCDLVNNRLNPGWGQLTYVANESQSTYHGLNAQLRKTYSHGLMFSANYTWGKVLDNVTEGGLGDYFNTNGYGGLYSGVQDIQNQRGDRGPSEFDATHRFALSALWTLPSPKSNGIARNVLGGWKLNSIVSLQSGRPFDVYCGLAWFSGCDFNMDGLAYDRPNRPAGIKTSGFSNREFVNGLFGDPKPLVTYTGFYGRTSLASQVFCPNGLNSVLDTIFVNPALTPCLPVGTNGNLSRNAFRGPAYKTVDLSLFKDIKAGDRATVQFQAEAFNLFNRVNLYNPISDLGSPQFGRSTAAFPARQVQLGLKVLF
jgi:Carboxypeptidase regulatory-like domain/TonB dependent receptor